MIAIPFSEIKKKIKKLTFGVIHFHFSVGIQIKTQRTMVLRAYIDQDQNQNAQ